MKKLLGLLLFMVGLAMAVLWIPARDGSSGLAQVVEITDSGIARVKDPNARVTVWRDGAESSDQQVAASAASPTLQGSEVLASSVQPTSSTRTQRMPPAGVAARPNAPVGPSGRVIAANAADEPAPPLGSAQPTTDEAYYALVRDLQRELRRLACYWGEVDGSWGPGSKRAMSALMERVNASLPVEQPDYILLALARSQPDLACRRPCLPDQVYMSDSGRCVPRALVTQAAADQVNSGSAPIVYGESIATGGAAAALPGQMSVGGPRPDAALGGAGPAVETAPRPNPTWYRYNQPRRDNTWKRRVFGDLYGR